MLNLVHFLCVNDILRHHLLPIVHTSSSMQQCKCREFVDIETDDQVAITECVYY